MTRYSAESVLHNVIIAVLSLLVQLPLSIALALLLNRKLRGGTLLRMAVFAPYVLSEATTAVHVAADAAARRLR